MRDVYAQVARDGLLNQTARVLRRSGHEIVMLGDFNCQHGQGDIAHLLANGMVFGCNAFFEDWVLTAAALISRSLGQTWTWQGAFTVVMLWGSMPTSVTTLTEPMI